ncbi:helix-turn-helix domain-containing protein [Paenibacillus doosanensis]|uniref:helix-turn-helix domain-containing protein n=1 Tax=Paenibacillus doosanensis TaxID=1229154 RepID=UPI00217F472F|nr:helix-turn-helix transcriptional regulator [Paenibacillus doosanensis]MCS7460830.1 helix-turn-helix domain-containing protein [Paenibacillus doosanensis]
MSKIAELVGAKIRDFRLERGFSQERLAFKAGLNTSYIGQLERGEKSPTLDSLEKVATALDVSLEELFRFSNSVEIEADYSIAQKIAFQLHGRSEMEQEAVYNFVKQLLWFRDRK